MTAIELPNGNIPDNLPVLTEVVSEGLPNDLPTLTEMIVPAEPVPTSPDAASTPRTYSEADVQRLLQQFEAHIETVFAQKLNHHLEELQKIAVDQAVNELKADLPELLRDALNAHPQSR
ncbi:MAG TPA: hypothetical protein VFW53_11185 [Gallionella sp.]|nr:hypothetical protein [Gallionella sp.]